MDLEGIMLTEIRQKKTNIAWYLLNVKSKNKIQKASEYSKKWTHRYREQTNGYQWGKGEGQNKGGRVKGTNYWM